MGLSKLLQVRPSRIKSKLDIDKCLMNEAREKRERKNGKRIRDFKVSEQGRKEKI